MLATSRVPRVLIAATVLALTGMNFAAAATPETTGPTIPVVDTAATTDTRSLFRYLREQQGDGILFGQQGPTTYGLSAGVGDGTSSDVYAGTGEYPAVFGFDTLIIDGHERPGVYGGDRGTNADLLGDAFVAADAKGAIPTLSAHMPNFVTGGSYNDTAGRVVSQILPGGAHHAEYTAYLDLIARAALGAEREDGSLVPVVFRPFHENTGGWFWWGSGHATSGEYKEIFRFTVEYLRDKKGVHNFLYAYSPNGSFAGDATRYLETYPGDQWVDVLGYDSYENSNDATDSDTWITSAVSDLAMIVDLAAERGKVAAFTEFGRNGARTIKPTGNKSLTFYTDLLAALKADPKARAVAYMLTWANFDSSQIYVPYPGHEMADDFRAFYDDEHTVFSAGVKAPHDLDATAGTHAAALRWVSPADGQRVVDATTTVRLKLTGVDPAAVEGVSFVRGGSVDVHELTYDAASGYWTTQWEIGEENLTNATSTVRATVRGADVAEATASVILGAAPSLPVGLVDDFEGYGDDAALRAQYTPQNASASVLSLTNHGGGKGLRLTYDFASTPGYLGVGRTFGPTQNWSGFSQVELDVVPDGSGNKLVVQIQAAGVAFEAYPRLTSTDPYRAVIPFADFVPAAWDTANAGATLTPQRLTDVRAAFLYLNDTEGARSGSLVFDDFRAAGQGEYVEPDLPPEPTADPILLDDFESYADDAALRAGWSNRGDAAQLSLNTDHVGSGNQAAGYAFDFTTQSYTQVARWTGGQNWSAHKQVSLWVDPNAAGQQFLVQFRTPPQPGSSDDTFWDLTHALSGSPGEISLKFADAVASWPSGIDPSVRPTPEQLAQINEVVLMATRQDWSATSTVTGTFYIDDLRVDGATASPPEEPEQPAPATAPTVVDDFESYATTAALRTTWGNRATYAGQLSLDTDDAAQGSQAMTFAYDFDSLGGFIDVSTWKNGQSWAGQERLSLRVRSDGSGHQLGVQFSTPAGRYFDAYLPLTAAGWTDVSVPFADFMQGWPADANKGKAPTDEELAAVNEVVLFLSRQSGASTTSGVVAIDDIQADRSDYATPTPTPTSEPTPTPTSTTEPTPTSAPTTTPTVAPTTTPAPTETTPGPGASPSPVQTTPASAPASAPVAAGASSLVPELKDAIRLSSSTATKGQSLRVWVGETHAGAWVSAHLYSQPRTLGGWHRVAADGSIWVTIPTDATAGQHRIAVQDSAGITMGWADLRIRGALASTGSDGLAVAALASLAMLVLVGGLVLVDVRRRTVGD